jgi:hypothetical protein
MTACTRYPYPVVPKLDFTRLLHLADRRTLTLNEITKRITILKSNLSSCEQRQIKVMKTHQ